MPEKIAAETTTTILAAGLGIPGVFALIYFLIKNLFPSLIKTNEFQEEVAERVWKRTQDTMDRLERRVDHLEEENRQQKKLIKSLEHDNADLEQKVGELIYQRDKAQNLLELVKSEVGEG